MNHAARVLKSLESKDFAAKSRLGASWRRSYEHHGIDPSNSVQKNRISQKELIFRKQSLEQLIFLAEPQLDELFGLICNSGCSVVLTDHNGLILDQRSSTADKDSFEEWGLCPGAIWSESEEGTNGIGTCLAEQRPVIIERDQHYLSKNIGMTCIGVPIHGANAELVGVLDVSSARLDHAKTTSSLIAATVKNAARHIETQNFRAHFATERVVLAGQNIADPSALVAINSDDCIIGATRTARKLFGWALDNNLQPIAATDIFNDNQCETGLRRGEKTAIVKAITRSNGNLSQAAVNLGIARATLYRRINRLGIQLPK